MIYLNDLVYPINGVLKKLLQSRFHGLASKGLMVISWSGRKTGKRFSTPVGYQLDGEAVVVLISKPAEKGWWKNFRSPWPAELTLKGEELTMMGTVVSPDSSDFFRYCEDTLRQLPWMGSQFGGIRYEADKGLDEGQKETLAEFVAIVRFELPG